jgi:hypothetical protein
MTSIPINATPWLRQVLLADAAASGAIGLLLLLGGGWLAAPLGLPAMLLHLAGLALLPWAAWLAAMRAPSRAALRAVVVVNLAWVADSLLLLLFAKPLGVAPTGLGVAFVLAQAAAVLGLALLQAAALRRQGREAVA